VNAGAQGRHVLILVENLSVPLDRRVWNECGSLVAAGYRVSVVCPRGARHDRAFHERRDGVEIYRYPMPPLIPGLAGYIWEYGYALLATLLLSLVIWGRDRFDIIQACNPPDLFFLVSAVYRRRGVAYVFDHHDANPEILVAKRGGRAGRGLPELVVGWAERRTFAAADIVMSPNDSYRRIALSRGGKRAEDVYVVRSGPRLEEFADSAQGEFDRRGHRFLVCYLGVMGRQDGVDLLVEAVALLVAAGYDILLDLIGAGESYDEIAALVRQRGLEDRVLMPGYQFRTEFTAALRSADVCVAPDPPSPFNDISTMNKIVEYMALGRPCVAFDLTENRVTGSDDIVYAPEPTVLGLAAAIGATLELGEERELLGRRARRRFEAELTWERSAPELLRAYARLTDDGARAAGPQGAARADADG